MTTLLLNPASGLVLLNLGCTSMGDKEAAVLATVLENSTLKEVILDRMRLITGVGWMAIFAALNNQDCRLKRLNVSYNSITDTAALALANGLTNSRSLESLNLDWNRKISPMGWQAIFVALQSPNCFLKMISLQYNRIANSMCALSAALESSNSSLEKIYLRKTGISDDTAFSLANSLNGNSKLTELLLDENRITIDGWSAFSQVLCNTTSIMSTYQSNHTVQKLLVKRQMLPENVRAILRLNRDNSQSEAARLEVIKAHFQGGFTTPPFLNMQWTLLPRAIAWMGSQGHGGGVDEHFFEFFRHTASWLGGVGARKEKEIAVF